MIGNTILSSLKPLGSPGELIVYPCSGVCPSSVVVVHCRSSPEMKAHKINLLIYGETRAGTRLSMGPLTLSNMNISETNSLVTIKFYLKDGPDQNRTLVFMELDI